MYKMGREDHHRKKKAKAHHGKSKKHKHKHKHKKKKRRRRPRAVAPTGLPSLPTIEQNQYWLLHGRIANLEAQGLQQGGAAAGGEKRMSRAEEIDVANRVIDENFKEQQQRDANRAARVQQDVIADQPVQAGDRAFLRSPDPSLRLSPARGRSPSPESGRAARLLKEMEEFELETTASPQPEPEAGSVKYLPEYKHKAVSESLAGDERSPSDFFANIANRSAAKVSGRAAQLAAMAEDGGGSPRFRRLREQGQSEATARQIDQTLSGRSPSIGGDSP